MKNNHTCNNALSLQHIPQKYRITWIDAGKCLGILMVMYGHNWLSWDYTYIFYAFHMPLFFILSGYTFPLKRSFKECAIKKFKVLLIPYLSFACIYILFYWVLSITHSGNFSPQKEVLLFLLQKGHTFLWFLPTLFLAEIMVKFLQSLRLIDNMLSTTCTCITLFFISGILTEYTHPYVWNMDLVPLATAFVLVGILYRKYYELKLDIKNIRAICLIVTCAVILDSINYILYGGVDMWGRKYGLYTLFILGALLSTYALILILKRIHFPHWMLYIGTASIIFYGLHRFIIELCFIGYSKLGIVFEPSSPYWIALAIFNVIITCFILYPVSHFINNKLPFFIGKF